MNSINNTLKIRSKKDYSTIIFLILWILAFAYKANDIYENLIIADLKTRFFDALFYLISIYFIYQLLWTFFGKKTFIIDNEKLIVKTGILFFNLKKEYDIHQIHNIKVEHDVQSNTYWGFQGIRIYSHTADVLTFDYKQRKITIGLNLEKFDVDRLKSIIK